MSYFNNTAVLSIFLGVVVSCWSARILVLLPAPLYSHSSYFYSLWQNLAERGHHLTIYTWHPMNDSTLTNVNEIQLTWNIDMNFTDLFKTSMNSISQMHKYYTLLYYGMPDLLLKTATMQSLINNQNEHFDLIMVESGVITLYAFAKKFDCPIIAISSLTGTYSSYKRIGNSDAFITAETYLVNSNLSFIEKLKHRLGEYFTKLIHEIYSPLSEQVIKKHFGHGYDIEEILNKVSLSFENTNNVFHPVRPLLPSIVQVNGLNLYSNHPNISEDLQRVLDDAKNGFIYVSFGTVLDGNAVSPALFLETFKQLPYTVLWKNAVENLTDVPSHVHISKWFPQFNVLRHKNIKLFVMQGGAHSMLEAIYNDVPMIAMPVYLDQIPNSYKIESFGIGLRVDNEMFDKDVFKKKIIEVAENTTYKENVKKLHKLINDQPQTGLEKAVFWTEYVIRHKGAPHFRSPVLDIPFYQYYLLDVASVVIVVLIVIFYILKQLIAVIKRGYKRVIRGKLKRH